MIFLFEIFIFLEMHTQTAGEAMLKQQRLRIVKPEIFIYPR